MNFPDTPWNILSRATLHGDSTAEKALNSFCSAYRGPLLGYILRRGLPPEEAEDTVQSFLLHLMQHSMLSRADQAQGRFRSYLFGALRHFMADRFDRASAQRRGGRAITEPLHFHESRLVAEPSDVAAAFDQEWAVAILQRALAAEETTRPPAMFAAIRAFLPGAGQPPSYAEAGLASGMSEAALRTEVSRMRARLRERIRSEVARTVDSPGEIDSEMAWLLSVLASG